jgi:uncharacterized protein with FMN-binding domain
MRKTLTALVSATTIALVSLDGAALARAAHAPAASNAVLLKRVTTKTFTGTTAQADRWGTVTINVKVRTTTVTTGTKKKVTRKVLDLGGSYTYHTDRSNFIMSQALPLLRQEFLQTQHANVQMISGATYTSQAFLASLQSALLKAGVKA